MDAADARILARKIVALLVGADTGRVTVKVAGKVTVFDVRDYTGANQNGKNGRFLAQMKRRRAQGLCARCGEPSDGFRLCEYHRQLKAKQDQRRRMRQMGAV